jgi:hypothetical protein
MRAQKHLQHEDRCSKYNLEELGHVVLQLVESQRYNPEGYGFDRNFLLTQSFRHQHL